MIYLQAENITKSYGDNVLFESISFGIEKKQKVALIARNGTGKSSLLNIITGADMADSGKIILKNDINISFLSQNPIFDNSKTVIEQVFNSSDKVIKTIKDYEEAIIENNTDKLQIASEKMDLYQAWDFEIKIKQILSKLKITDFSQKVAELSGGQKKRLALAETLIKNPDLLILDEPTNHLDLEMIEWLEEYINKLNISVLMVTHDRYFLDKICNYIIEIDNRSLYKYKGNYTYFLQKKDERINIQNANVEKAKNLYKKEIEWMRRQPQARATKAKYRIEEFYKIKEQTKQKIVQKELKLDIKTRRLGKKVLDVYNIKKAYDDLLLIDDFSYKFSRNEKIGIVGKNGTGKSTFLNVITGDIPYDSGKIETGETIVFGYYKQGGITIKPKQRLIDVIKEISESIELAKGKILSASQFLEYFLFPTEMHYTYTEKLSGGERRKLYLMTVLMKNPNFLILDEPTNDLDIFTLNVLEEYLTNFSGCVVIVSHDRYFMDKIVDNILAFDGKGRIKNFPGNYSDYRYYLDKLEKEKKTEIKEKAKPKQKEIKIKKQKLTYKQRLEIKDIEKEIELLEAEKLNIENELSTNTIKSEKIIENSKRLSQIIETLDEKEMSWLELSEIE